MVEPYQRIVSLVCIDCETCECEKCNVEDLAKRIIDDVRADAIDEYTCKSDCEYGGTCEMCVRWDKLADCYEPAKEQ